MTNKKTLEIVHSWTGQYLWRFKAGNGEQVSQGESFTSKQSAHEGALTGSPVIDIDAEEGTITYVEVMDDVMGAVEGNYKYVDLFEDDHGKRIPRPGNSDEGALEVGKLVQNNAAVVFLIESGVSRDAQGHFVVNGLTLHPKHPERDNCALTECDMQMTVAPV